MKYTIFSPETEQKLAGVELTDKDAGGWQVSLFDNKGTETKTRLMGASFKGRKETLEVFLSSGERIVYPIHSQNSDGSLVVATALGNLRILATRGTPMDTGGGAAAGAKSIKSSMPGKVLKILCKPGDQVEAGQPMLIIEAMKMENEIRSPQPGMIEEVPVQIGQKVETGELLVKLGKKS